jgi:hypothetical protein
MTWSIFGGASEPAALSVDNDDIFECDYDNNPTGLYQAMENEAWLPALDFLETGKWQDALLGTKIFSSDDPLTPRIQARTWVTRYDDDGTVRWSQLPLHAAIIFKAPVKIIVMLVKLHPQGVRCTDDQHMLPLHLAIKYGAEDIVLRLLVDNFPEAISTKDSKGRLPIQIEGPRQDRTKAMEGIIAYTTKTVRRQHEASFERELRESKEKLILKDKLIEELGMHNHELERVFKKLQNENVMLKGAIETMEINARLTREPHGSRTPTIRGPLLTGPLKVLLGTSPEAAAAAAGILQDIRGQEALGTNIPPTTEYVSAAECPASPKAAATTLKNKKSKSPISYFTKSKMTSPRRGRSSPPVDPEEESKASTARVEPEGVRNDDAAPQSESRSPQPESPLSTTSRSATAPGSTTLTDKVIASRQKYQRHPNVDESNSETIPTALPKRQAQAAKSKKLPRRGFFMGMSTKE